MKIFIEFLPIILFFAAYQLFDIYVATAVAMAASLAQVGWGWWAKSKLETLPLITAGLILVLGGATLLLQDEAFIKWKPTAVNWLFAAVFLGSQWLSSKPAVAWLMGHSLALPPEVWVRLNLAWAGFFTFLGAINLWVAYTVATETWVQFKLFGMLGLTLAFVLAQGFYLAGYLEPEPQTPELPKE
ncbi:MAG: septation protein A [Candidatus Competibacteraceae bacterium]|nr:septation protein A [Candidatus Competibacteraceae bacterium]